MKWRATARNMLNTARRNLPAFAPVLIALAVAVLFTWAWLSGKRLFGVALIVPTDVEAWAKVLGFSFGIPAGVLALFTYVSDVQEQRSAGLWKRREYVAERFDRLEGLRDCRAVMRMLDYTVTYVDLGGPEKELVNDRLVMGALAPRSCRPGYTKQEQAIREAFDTFLSEMDRLGAMANAGLVAWEDLAPYADYWLVLFRAEERGRPEAYAAILRRYVRVFHFEDLGAWLQRQDLIAFDGPEAKDQARIDNALISDFNPLWVAPPDGEAPAPCRDRAERRSSRRGLKQAAGMDTRDA